MRLFSSYLHKHSYSRYFLLRINVFCMFLLNYFYKYIPIQHNTLKFSFCPHQENYSTIYVNYSINHKRKKDYNHEITKRIRRSRKIIREPKKTLRSANYHRLVAQWQNRKTCTKIPSYRIRCLPGRSLTNTGQIQWLSNWCSCPEAYLPWHLSALVRRKISDHLRLQHQRIPRRIFHLWRYRRCTIPQFAPGWSATRRRPLWEKLSHPKKAPHPVQSVIRLCDETRNYLQGLLSLCQHHQI